jgi:hypothetical protein
LNVECRAGAARVPFERDQPSFEPFERLGEFSVVLRGLGLNLYAKRRDLVLKVCQPRLTNRLPGTAAQPSTLGSILDFFRRSSIRRGVRILSVTIEHLDLNHRRGRLENAGRNTTRPKHFRFGPESHTLGS